MPKRTESSESGTGDNSKGRVQHWIHEQVSGFLDKWEGSADQNPALGIVKKLVDAAKELEPSSSSCLSAVGVSTTSLEVKCSTLMSLLFPGTNFSGFNDSLI